LAAAPPAALVGSTVRHAALTVAGPAAAGAIPPQIAVLVTGVLRTMTYSNTPKVLLVALAAILLGGVGLAWQQGQPRVRAAEPAAAPDPAAAPQAVRHAQGDKDAAGKDLALLQGTWKVTAMEFGGQSLPAELLTGYKHTFAGNKLTWDRAVGMMSKAGQVTAIEGVYECTFKIDPGKEPKQIDITLRMPKGDRTVLGIYEIKGETLRLCFSFMGRRPAEFSSKDNPHMGNMVL